MTIFEGPYLKQNKFLLMFFGLWPYQSKYKKRFNFIVFGASAMSLLIPMVEGLVDDTNTDIVIFFETIVAIMLIFGGFAQTIMLLVRQYPLRNLYEHIARDWRAITDINELKILQNFSQEGRTLVTLFLVCSTGCYLLFITFTYMPLLMDDKVSKDYTKIFPYYSNRWIIYYGTRNLQVAFHASLVIFYGGVVYIVVIAIYIFSVKHTCAMYAIINYRLTKLVKTKSLTNLKDNSNIVPELLAIISKHKETIKRLQMIIQIFNRSFFAVEIGLLLCLALLIFDVKYNINNVRLMFRILFITILFILHAFYMNYCGEQIIQYSNGVNSAAYFMKWYSLSVKARKMIFMISVRTSKPDILNAGIMTLSLENFATIIKASWSLGTVLLTSQKMK